MHPRAYLYELQETAARLDTNLPDPSIRGQELAENMFNLIAGKLNLMGDNTTKGTIPSRIIQE